MNDVRFLFSKICLAEFYNFTVSVTPGIQVAVKWSSTVTVERRTQAVGRDIILHHEIGLDLCYQATWHFDILLVQSS